MKTLTPALAATALAAILLSGCWTIRPRIVPYVPDPARALPTDKARLALAETLTRARCWRGEPIEDVRVGEQRLQYKVVPPRNPSERLEADVAYSEASVLITEIDAVALKTSGPHCVSFQRGDQADLERAFYFDRLEDAQTVSDLFGGLGAAERR